MLKWLNINKVNKITASLALLFLVFSASWADSMQSQPSLTLQDLLNRAIRNHPVLRQSQASINLEKGIETESWSALFPQVNFNNSFQRGNSHGGSFGASSTFTSYNSAFSLNQLITDFGKTGDIILANRLAVAQASENYQVTYQQVLFNVYQTYYLLLFNRANVKVQEDSVKSLQNHLSQTQAFYHVGTHPKIDVTQAEVNLSNGEYTLVQAQNNLALAQTNLENAVGGGPLPAAQIEGTLTFKDFPITLDDALKSAYQKRPDLLALEDGLKSAQASLAAASKGQFPVLAGSAGYGWNGGAFPPADKTWSLGVTLNVPLFNGFLTQGETQAARAQADEISAQLDNLKLTVNQSVEQALLNLKAAKNSFDVAEDSLRFARENLRLAEGRYKVGLGNYLEFTDAQVGLVQAETNEVQALANYNIAVAALNQAMGLLGENR